MVRKSIVWGTVVYTLGLMSLLLFWKLGADVWWVVLPGIAAPFLYLPLPLLVPLRFWVRSSVYLLAVGVLSLVFVFSFGGYFLPRSPGTDSADGAKLRIMSLNHLKTNTDEAAIKAAILRQDADIVALQELSLNVAAMVKAELLGRYPHQVLRPSLTDGANGIGVLSRLPLERPSYSEAYRGQRFSVEVSGTRFELINVHLNVPFQDGSASSLRNFQPELRDRQLAALVGAIGRAPSLIVVGDFNLSDQEQGYRDLAERMTDAYRSTRSGFGFTFPHGRVLGGIPLLPLVRLDYVWLRGLEPLSAHRDCRSGSDHCAVIADVRLP